jgi:hypothetical protein
LALLTTSAQPVMAQATSSPVNEDVKISPEAVRLYDEGRKEAAAQRWAEARKHFLAAWGVQKHWQIAANLGWSEFMLKMHRDAAEHLAYSLRKAPNRVTAEERKPLQAMHDQSVAEVGSLIIQVNEPSAKVFVDGKPLESVSPGVAIYVEPGSHNVEAKLSGHAPGKATLNVVKGTSQPATLQLVPCRNAIAGTEAGAYCGVEPSSGIEKWKLPVVGAAGAVAVVGLAVGIIYTTRANQKAMEADDKFNDLLETTPPEYFLCGSNGYPKNTGACNELLEIEKSQDRRENTARAGFIIGGTAALGAAAAFFLWPSSKKREGMAVVPAVSPNHAGAVVVGTF